MTQILLNSRLTQHYRVFHMNTSRQRPVHTKGHFDLLNVLWGGWHVLRLAGLLARRRPDVVVLPFAQNRAASLRDGLFVVMASVAGARVLAILHNSTFREFYDRCGVLFQRFLRLVLKRIDRVIVLAAFLLEQFGGLVQQNRLRVCYNGVDPEPFRRQQDTRSEASKVRCLFVGHLSHAKGAFDVLKAFRLAASQCPGLGLTMIGAPIRVERNVTTAVPGEEQWETSLAEAVTACPGQIQVPGVVTGDDKARLFQASDIFILPSYSEAFPVSVLEAMAASMPVIVTPVGALPEVLEAGTNALFVRPGDPEQLGHAIVQLATDQNRRQRMGKANRELVDDRFTVSHFENRLIEILAELDRPSALGPND